MRRFVPRVRIGSRLCVWFNLVATLAAAASALAAGNARKGEVLYTSCVRCHGAKAEGLEEFKAPRLAGVDDWYFKEQMKKFRTRQRGYDDPKESGFLESEPRTKFMHPLADHFKRGELDHLLAFIRLQNPGPVAPPREGNAGRGQKSYAACAACHGQYAEGNRRKGAPRLIGQHAWYLTTQVLDFRMGWRGTHPKDPHGKLMRSNTDLDDAAIKDIVAYVVSLDKPRRK